MTSAVLIALVGLAYFVVAIDLGLIQQRYWHGLVWAGYAIAQVGLWQITIRP